MLTRRTSVTTLLVALVACGEGDAPATPAAPADAPPAAGSAPTAGATPLAPAEWIAFVEREHAEEAALVAERDELLRRYEALDPEERARFDAELERLLPSDDARVSGHLLGNAYPAAWLSPDELPGPTVPPPEKP